MIDKNLIKQKIVKDLQKINPQKIIVFGSFIRDDFIEEYSDIDLLIIKESNLSLPERYSQARLSLTINQPFDIFVLTENELANKLQNNFFFREIVSQGEIIYEKK